MNAVRDEITDLRALFDEMKASVDATFERVSWMEQTIARYMADYPDRAAWIWDCFKYGSAVRSIVYENRHAWQSHCEELIRRVAKKQSLLMPTHAEMVFIFKEISVRIPLHGEPAWLYQWLFADVFPDHAAEIGLPVGQPMPPDCRRYYDMLCDVQVIHRQPPDPKQYQSLCEEPAPEPVHSRPLRQLRLFR